GQTRVLRRNFALPIRTRWPADPTTAIEQPGLLGPDPAPQRDSRRVLPSSPAAAATGHLCDRGGARQSHYRGGTTVSFVAVSSAGQRSCAARSAASAKPGSFVAIHRNSSRALTDAPDR